MATITMQPLNTEWNRKTGIIEGTGAAVWLGTHNGTAYFTWTDAERGTIHLKCEENFFLKNFRIPKVNLPVPDVKEIDGFDKIKFLNYPFDLVKG